MYTGDYMENILQKKMAEAVFMLSGIILVVGNFIADILYAFADPRIKREDMAND